MKRSICNLAFMLMTASLSAQLTFTNSSTNLPTNFAGNGICTFSSSTVYMVGGVFNSGWTPYMFSSTDNGSSWAILSPSGIASDKVVYNSICYTGSKLLLNARDGQVTAAEMYSSTNGSSWSNSSTGLAANFLAADMVCTSSSQMYAVGSHYNLGWTAGIYESIDGGSTWTSISTSGIGSDQEFYNSICNVGSTLLMSTQDGMIANTGIYASTDGGNTWTLSNTGIPLNFLTRDLAVISPNKIYAFGSLYSTSAWIPGVYGSTDGGANWSAVNVNGIASAQVYFNASCLVGNKLILATQNSNATTCDVYATYVGPPLNVGIEESAVTYGLLFFPNPAGDELEINLDREFAQVNLALIDLRGECVYSQKYDHITKAKLDVSDLAKGIYLLKLQSGAETLTRKFVKE